MKKNQHDSAMSEHYFDRSFVETNVLEFDQELPHYPHCRLPNHYFDLLLSRSMLAQDSQHQNDPRETEAR